MTKRCSMREWRGVHVAEHGGFMDAFADECERLLRRWTDDLSKRIRKFMTWCGKRQGRGARTAAITVGSVSLLMALLVVLREIMDLGKPASCLPDPAPSQVAWLDPLPQDEADGALEGPPDRDVLPDLGREAGGPLEGPPGTEALPDPEPGPRWQPPPMPKLRLPAIQMPAPGPEPRKPERRSKEEEEKTVPVQKPVSSRPVPAPPQAVSVKREAPFGDWRAYVSSGVSTSSPPEPTLSRGGINPTGQVGSLEFAERQSRALYR